MRTTRKAKANRTSLLGIALLGLIVLAVAALRFLSPGYPDPAAHNAPSVYRLLDRVDPDQPIVVTRSSTGQELHLEPGTEAHTTVLRALDCTCDCSSYHKHGNTRDLRRKLSQHSPYIISQGDKVMLRSYGGGTLLELPTEDGSLYICYARELNLEHVLEPLRKAMPKSNP